MPHRPTAQRSSRRKAKLLRPARIGEFAYAVYEEAPLEEARFGAVFDFALIRLDPGVHASPEVCHFGGPTTINSDIVPITTPVMLHYYGTTWAGGHLLPVGSSEPADGQWLLPARTGLASGLPESQRAYFYGHAFIGDSGAPVLSRTDERWASSAALPSRNRITSACKTRRG